jgi:hypothetical protein
LFAGGFRGALQSRIYLQEFEQSLAEAETIEECWRALRGSCRDTNFSYVGLRIGTRYFEDKLQPAVSTASRTQVLLSHSDSATFDHDPNVPGPAMLIAPFVERLQAKLKLCETQPVAEESASATSAGSPI